MALLSLQLWQLTDLAGSLVVILGAQTLTIALYAAFVTFRVMGKITMLRCFQQVIVVLRWVQHQLPLLICKQLPICMVRHIKPF